MQNVVTSDDERKVSQEYQRFKRKQSWVLSICEKKMQEVEEPDYLQIKGSRSTSDLGSEEEIKVQHMRPIGGNTTPLKSTKTAYFGIKVIYVIYYIQDHLRALHY